MSGSLRDDVRDLAHATITAARGTRHERASRRVADRLDEPLRVAIAGRVNAGKSTLLNALVGERLAATDASETTRLVTWYRWAIGYEVRAATSEGWREVPFRRAEGSLELDLRGLDEREIERLEVGWPSRRLERQVLIDTPGLGSVNVEVSERTRSALVGGAEEGATGSADAVVYLMPHLHAADTRFLEAFHQGTLAGASPVNAVAVLSRADEIGGGRSDALESARHIAARYAADARIRAIASTVIPVAGLLAETAATLREEEVRHLRALAELPPPEREQTLLSVDRVRVDSPRVSPAERERLLVRLGLFGIRLAVELLASGAARSGADVARALLDASGVPALRTLIEEQFAARASALRARSALGELRLIVLRLAAEGHAPARSLESRVERLEVASGALSLLRLLHLTMIGEVRLPDEQRAEVERLASERATAQRVGLAAEAQATDIQAAALAGVERWRMRAENPLADRAAVEAAEIVARAYEEIHRTAVVDAQA